MTTTNNDNNREAKYFTTVIHDYGCYEQFSNKDKLPGNTHPTFITLIYSTRYILPGNMHPTR